MRKNYWFLALVLLLAFSPILIWSGGQQEKGPVKLTVAGRDGGYGKAMQIAVDEYSKLHPDVSFEVLKLPGSSLYEKVVIDMKNSVGTYDVIMIDDPIATQFQKAGWLANLDELYKKKGTSPDTDLISTAVKLGRYPYTDNGALYALPHVGNVELFAYRKDIFAKLGLSKPAKWNDVLADAKMIKQSEPDVYGVVFRGVKGNPIVAGFLPIYWAFGAKVLDNGKPALNSPQALNALNFFLKLKKYAPEGVSMYNSAQVKDALYGGKAGIVTEVWPSWVPKLNDPNESRVVNKVEVTTHPGEVEKSSPMIGVWLLGIPKASKHHTAAFDFLLYITGKEMQVKLADETGLAPTRDSVYKVSKLIAKYPWYPVQAAALKNAVGRPRTIKWSELENIFGTYLQLALVGSMSAQDALKEANAKMAEVLE
ncbi:MAG: sugar ABC transporter substrate-binding protein [Spirochaetes bacterium]|nr:MAG: sugar ABC transporter substrate-binding protein [Spirochaetota bacterium]